MARIKKIDADLQTEYYTILEQRGEEIPSVKQIAPENMDNKMIMKEYKEKLADEEERIKDVKREYVEGEDEFWKSEILLQEKQDEIDRLDEEENRKRESGKAASVIPTAIKADRGGYSSGGAVSGTDSESESEFQSKIKGKRVDKAFKWTPETEEQLEEFLIKHSFDFKAATRDFVKEINKDDQQNFFSMDVKTLQLRWTDIEIRKYRLADSFAPKPLSSGGSAEDDEELPPLEDGPKDQIDSRSRSSKTTDSSRHLLRPMDEKEMEDSTKTPNMNTNFFDYRDDSSSDDETKNVGVTHYNDLEELD